MQKAALSAFRGCSHLVCVAPTGSGKSRIYETFIDQHRPRAVLLGPLIALARQQADSLAALGVPVFGRFSLLKGTSCYPRHRESGVWILSPESLLRAGTVERLRRWRPELLVMDECHSCWDWGETFRPA